MARKPDSLDAQRAVIRRRYKSGKQWGAVGRKTRKKDGEELSPEEIGWKQAQFVFLRAADYSYAYVSDNLQVTQRTLRNWHEDEKIQARIAEVRDNMLDGALLLLKTYAIEAVEMLMEIARRTGDDKEAIHALVEVLDRAGLTKVNKSESNVHRSGEVHHTDDRLLERIQKIPLEAQKKVAELMEMVEKVIDESSEEGDKK